MKDALERKKAAVLLLASAQKDVETHTSFMIEEQGLDEAVGFYNTHYKIEDRHTALGRFIKAASSLTFRAYSLVKGQGPVGCLISYQVLSILLHSIYSDYYGSGPHFINSLGQILIHYVSFKCRAAAEKSYY